MLRTSKKSITPQRARRRARGFTLLELMIVLSVMMILMAVAVPMYQQHVVQPREAVLKQNIDQLNKVIERYGIDSGSYPQSLNNIVTAGYFHQLPIDPMTTKADWATDPEDSTNALDPQEPGILRVHSASTGTALNGEAYSSW